LSLAPGESIALLGGNGAGKTALLRYIAGLLPRNGGTCVVHGQRVASTRAAVAAGIGLVVQDPDDQLLGATLQEDAEIGPRNLRLSPQACAERVRDALATLDLTALAEREIEMLSLGERKRASLAGVLAMHPRLLLLDEPTAGLDPRSERALCDSLRQLTEAGRTLLVATHAVDLVPYFATRVVLLAGGRIIADGPCRDVLANDALLERARMRRPWPVELWSRVLRERVSQPPLTLEELTPLLTHLTGSLTVSVPRPTHDGEIGSKTPQGVGDKRL
jgi:cobalt/nickel transport system ATP-binding protein